MKGYRESIGLLETRDLLVWMEFTVSADLENLIIKDRVYKSPTLQNQALLLEKATGYDL